MVAFVIGIATGFEGRVLLALGIAVVASGGWVAWLRAVSEDLWRDHALWSWPPRDEAARPTGKSLHAGLIAAATTPGIVGQRVAATVTPAGRQILETAALAAA
jgi:hypothetical protein